MGVFVERVKRTLLIVALLTRIGQSQALPLAAKACRALPTKTTHRAGKVDKIRTVPQFRCRIVAPAVDH